MKSLVETPHSHVVEYGRREQVQIDIPEPSAHQTPRVNEREHFAGRGSGGHGKFAEQLEDDSPLTECAARQLPDDKWMCAHLTCIEQRRESRISTPQMIDPDRGVYEDHGLRELPGARGRRRGGTDARGSEAPSAASRRALSRATSARSPSCTSAVFSSIRVRRLASPRRASSRLSVVFICTSMDVLYICRKTLGDAGRRYIAQILGNRAGQF